MSNPETERQRSIKAGLTRVKGWATKADLPKFDAINARADAARSKWIDENPPKRRDGLTVEQAIAYHAKYHKRGDGNGT